MNKPPIIRDERYTAVENASYRIGYMVLAFGTLVLIVFRSLVYRQTNWDLFALVIISSFAATIYQARNKILQFTWKYLYYLLAAALLAAIVAYIASFFLK